MLPAALGLSGCTSYAAKPDQIANLCDRYYNSCVKLPKSDARAQNCRSAQRLCVTELKAESAGWSDSPGWLRLLARAYDPVTLGAIGRSREIHKWKRETEAIGRGLTVKQLESREREQRSQAIADALAAAATAAAVVASESAGTPATNLPATVLPTSPGTASSSQDSRGGTPADAFDAMESSCGEPYRGTTDERDHGRFYCMRAYAAQCTLKSGANPSEKRTLTQMCDLAPDCPHCP